MRARTKTFALDVLEFARGLPASESLSDIRRQLTRSSTAVGANYRSACRARSRAEFIARIGVVLEEADESAFWFEILVEQRSTIDRQRALALLDEGESAHRHPRSNPNHGEQDEGAVRFQMEDFRWKISAALPDFIGRRNHSAVEPRWP